MTTPAVPLLTVTDVHKRFASRRVFGTTRHVVRAVNGVSLELHRGETLAVVGETGSGKSTIGRLVLSIIAPDEGEIVFDGMSLQSVKRAELRSVRRRMRMIFQDPFSSLNPSITIGSALRDPLRAAHKRAAQRDVAAELLDQVGLRPEHLDRFPYELSGGQLQRVAIARALATEPDLIVCDEAVSALDVSIQAQVLNLLVDLQQRRSLAYLFITHDLALVRLFADRVAVMQKGMIVEQGPTATVLSSPTHAYTSALVEAVPVADPDRRHYRHGAGSARRHADVPPVPTRS